MSCCECKWYFNSSYYISIFNYFCKVFNIYSQDVWLEVSSRRAYRKNICMNMGCWKCHHKGFEVGLFRFLFTPSYVHMCPNKSEKFEFVCCDTSRFKQLPKMVVFVFIFDVVLFVFFFFHLDTGWRWKVANVWKSRSRSSLTNVVNLNYWGK